MNLGLFLNLLESNKNASLRFTLPDGKFVESHFHVTEIGKITKDFIDCGGTHRNKQSCILQLWVANDSQHNLKSDKLLKIFSLAEYLKLDKELPVEVQYGLKQAVVYDIASCRFSEHLIDIILTPQITNCLAPDKCGVKCCSNGNCC